jgi:hypothetical protein
MTPADLIISAFFITGFVNIIVYTGLGLVDFKYFIMFFSLSALYAIKRLRRTDIPEFGFKTVTKIPARQVFAVALAILFILKFATYIGPILDERSLEQSVDMDLISDMYLEQGTGTISDLRLSGQIMLMHSEKGNREFNSFVYSANYLNRLISGNATDFQNANKDIHYIIMTGGNMDGNFNIGNWESWGSANDIVSSVGNYSDVQRIYSSHNLCIWAVNI